MRLALVDVAGEHALGEKGFVLLRAVGRIGPYPRGRVVRTDQRRQPCASVGIGGAGIPGADQAMRPVDADMVLVAEHRDGQIDRLECLGVRAFLDLGLGVLDAPAGIAILFAGSSKGYPSSAPVSGPL